MKTWHIAVGSTRRPKLNAVKEAALAIAPLFGEGAALGEEVLSCGTELAAAIDQLAGAVGIRDGQGAWGVLSRNLISRQESFRVAVVAAFAPFYNAKMYRASATAGGDGKGAGESVFCETE